MIGATPPSSICTGARQRQLREFAPHSPKRLILPSRGANPSPGKAPGGRGSLRPAPGKALFFRRGAQTFCREEAPAAAGVCAPFPGKPYSSVERRKPFTRKSPGGCGSLRLPPGKALFFRRGAQTLHPGRAPRRRCEFAPHSRESLILPSRGANPSPGKSPRRRREFAPHTRESLILPLRGANPSPGRGAGGCGSLRPIPGKALFFR